MGTPDPDERIETGRRSVLAAAAGGLSLGALGAASGSAAAQDGETVTILHDTHFHGRFEDANDSELNVARYYSVIEDLRAEHENSAFLGNGDDLAPSVLGIEYEGEHMVEALNDMEPAAIGAGNHEFDFGVDVAEERFAESEFPWVIANLLTPDGDPVPGTERWTTVEAGDVAVGVFGMGTEGFHDITDYPDDWQVLDTVEAAREAVAHLREEEEVDVVVCASHVSTGAQERLAEEVDGLDAIVGSHSGVVFEEPQVVDGTVIAEFGDEYDHLGRLTFDADSGELVDWERVDFYNSEHLDDDEDPPGTDHDRHRPVDVHDVSPDEDLQALADEYTDELEERLGEPVVESEVELDATFDNYAIETGWGNLLTDLMREVGDLDREIDVAVQNAGGIRSDATYGPGEITGQDVMNILPFPNEIEVYEVTGAQLAEYLEGSVRPMPGDFGAQPAIQVSGVSYEWRGHDGEASIDNVFVGGEPLEEDDTYLVATNDFVAGRSVIGEGEHVLHSGQLQGPYVMNTLDEEYETVAPEREHRMIRVDEDVGAAAVEHSDGVTLRTNLPANAAEDVAELDTFRAVNRLGEVAEAEAVDVDGETIAATFDDDELGSLADVDDPAIRLLGGFDPDEDHYDYEGDDGEPRDLPASSGYDHFKLKASVNPTELEAAVETPTEAEDEDAHEAESGQDDGADDSGRDDENGDGAADEAENSVPGFGAGAGAAGVAGGAYLHGRYASDADGDDA